MTGAVGEGILSTKRRFVMQIQPNHHVGEKVFFLCRAKSSNGPEMPAIGYGTILAVKAEGYEDGGGLNIEIEYRVQAGAGHVFITDDDILDGFDYSSLTLGRLEDEVKGADEEFQDARAAKNTVDAVANGTNFIVQEDLRG